MKAFRKKKIFLVDDDELISLTLSTRRKNRKSLLSR